MLGSSPTRDPVRAVMASACLSSDVAAATVAHVCYDVYIAELRATDLAASSNSFAMACVEKRVFHRAFEALPRGAFVSILVPAASFGFSRESKTARLLPLLTST